jgi:uncharacterized membrane protein
MLYHAWWICALLFLTVCFCLLLQDRKSLTKGGFRDRHWNWGSLLLGVGVLIAIEGPVNTYLRTGEAVCARSGCAGTLWDFPSAAAASLLGLSKTSIGNRQLF